MKKLVFASNNAHKLAEIRSILAGRVEVVSLSDIDCHDDIPETADTLEGNALIKARHIWEHYGLYCFADDTGLEVDALDGAPGVYSARFAGEKATFEDNISLLLERLKGVPAPRRAAFRTVIALIDEYGTHLFEGSVAGEITEERLGGQGFGYDPVFLPAGQTKTFAQLTESEKNSMSHRGRAIQKLVSYLCALHEA
ncbi:MAG: non-canonical purine NTP diphosphatase [Porphyromonadaceae bacterium]|jgi:non-canonical purine NTP pyrophosphatase, rdgB/HAM1 family|nr:non-canonical purine NTP diphosphatase [Porphyromonadaceae bacterium]